MYFPKQHYESIVPEKSGINRFSASHDIDLFYFNILHNQHYVQRNFPPHNSANITDVAL